MKIIDVHSHLLFGVDDGAKTLEQSVRMCETEVENNVTDAICTPHMRLNVYTPKQQDIINAYESLTAELKKRNIPLKLHLGREFHHNAEYARRNDYDIKYTMCGKKYLLLELPDGEQDAGEACYGYAVRGYNVILAHAERYALTVSDVAEIKGMGVEIQVNAFSLIGKMPNVYKKRARDFLKNGYVDYVASDYHFVRKNVLKKAYSYVSKKYGEDTAVKLFYQNAEKIIND